MIFSITKERKHRDVDFLTKDGKFKKIKLAPSGEKRKAVKVQGLMEGEEVKTVRMTPSEQRTMGILAVLNSALIEEFGAAAHTYAVRDAAKKAADAGVLGKKLNRVAERVIDYMKEAEGLSEDIDTLKPALTNNLAAALLEADSSVDLFSPQILSSLLLTKVYSNSIFKEIVSIEPMEGYTKKLVMNIPYFVDAEGNRREFNDFSILFTGASMYSVDLNMGSTINLVGAFPNADPNVDVVEPSTVKINKINITTNNGTIETSVALADGINNGGQLFTPTGTDHKTIAIKLIPRVYTDTNGNSKNIKSWTINDGDLMATADLSKRTGEFSISSAVLSGLNIDLVLQDDSTVSGLTYSSARVTVEYGISKEMFNRNTKLEFEQKEFDFSTEYRTIEQERTYRNIDINAANKAIDGYDFYAKTLNLIATRFALDMDKRVIDIYGKAARLNCSLNPENYYTNIDVNNLTYKEVEARLRDNRADIEAKFNIMYAQEGISEDATVVMAGRKSLKTFFVNANIVDNDSVKYVESVYLENGKGSAFFRLEDTLNHDGTTIPKSGGRILVTFKGEGEASKIGIYGAATNKQTPDKIELKLRQNVNIYTIDDGAALIRPEVNGQIRLSFDPNN